MLHIGVESRNVIGRERFTCLSNISFISPVRVYRHPTSTLYKQRYDSRQACCTTCCTTDDLRLTNPSAHAPNAWLDPPIGNRRQITAAALRRLHRKRCGSRDSITPVADTSRRRYRAAPLRQDRFDATSPSHTETMNDSRCELIMFHQYCRLRVNITSAIIRPESPAWRDADRVRQWRTARWGVDVRIESNAEVYERCWQSTIRIKSDCEQLVQRRGCGSLRMTTRCRRFREFEDSCSLSHHRIGA